MGSRCARARSPPRQSPVNTRAFAGSGIASRSKTRSLSTPADSRGNCFTAGGPFHPEGRSCGQVSRIFLNANYARWKTPSDVSKIKDEMRLFNLTTYIWAPLLNQTFYVIISRMFISIFYYALSRFISAKSL